MKSILRLCLVAFGLLAPTSAFAANWVAQANGNWTANATWALVDSASYLNVENTGATALTTSYTGGTTGFVAANVAVQAIAVKIAKVSGTVGTMTCALYDVTTTTSLSTVTVNLTDLPSVVSTATNEGGWFIMQLGSPVTPNGIAFFEVRCLTSTTGQVFLWANATSTTTWDEMLITTTATGPATADNYVIGAWWTAAATKTNFTVTNNQASATALGTDTAAIAPLTVATPALAIVQGGTLSAVTNAASQLAFAGNVVIYNGGTLSEGTSGTPVPIADLAQFQIVPTTTDGDFGLVVRNGGTLNTYGVPRTAATCATGAACVMTHLFCSAAGGACASANGYLQVSATEGTSGTNPLPVVDSTGWLSGDSIVVAGTNKGANQAELLALGSNAGVATLTTTATTANTHLANIGSTAIAYTGTNGVSYSMPAATEVINLTRNVTINNGSARTAGKMTYIYLASGATWNGQWTEIFNIGANVAGKRGIEADTTTGAVSLTYSSIHDTKNFGFYLAATQATFGNFTLQYDVVYNCGSTLGPCLGFFTAPPSNAYVNTWVVDNFTGILAPVVGAGANGTGSVTFKQTGGQFTNIALAGFGDSTSTDSAIFFSQIISFSSIFGTWGPITIHSSPGYALLSSCLCNGKINGIYTYHNAFASEWASVASDITVDPYYSIGDGFGTGVFDGHVTLRNGLIAADAFSGASIGGVYSDDGDGQILLDNMELNPSSAQNGAFVTYTTRSDFSEADGTHQTNVNEIGRNTAFYSTLANNNLSSKSQQTCCWTRWSYGTADFMPLSGVTGLATKVVFMPQGYIARDTGIVNNSEAQSVRMVMNASIASTLAGATLFSSPPFQGIKAAVKNGTAANVCVYTRTSVVGDGTAYTGAAPQIWERANPAVGVQADTSLVTTSGSAGVWTQTCANTSSPTADGEIELAVGIATGSGVAGWVNIADWSCTNCQNPLGGQGYWFNGFPFDSIVPASAGHPPFIGG